MTKAINIAASGTDVVVIPAVTDKRIIVTGAFFMAGATATNLTFNTKGASAGTAISPLCACGSNGGANMSLDGQTLFETNIGESLTATTGSGSTIGILVVYRLE